MPGLYLWITSIVIFCLYCVPTFMTLKFCMQNSNLRHKRQITLE